MRYWLPLLLLVSLAMLLGPALTLRLVARLEARRRRRTDRGPGPSGGA